MAETEELSRVGDVVIEHDSLHSWWRCTRCHRRGQKNHSNDETVRWLLPSLCRKAEAHIANCRGAPLLG